MHAGVLVKSKLGDRAFDSRDQRHLGRTTLTCRLGRIESDLIRLKGGGGSL